MANYLIDLGVVEGLEMSSTYPVLALSLTYNGVTQKETLTLQGEGYWADATGNVSIGIDSENEHVTIYNNWGEPDVGHEYGVEISCSELSESFTDSTQKVIEKGIETLINSMTIEDDTNPTVVNALFFDRNGNAVTYGLGALVVKGSGESVVYAAGNGHFAPPSNAWVIEYDTSQGTMTFVPSNIEVPFTLELYESHACNIPASLGQMEENFYYPDGANTVREYGAADMLVGSQEIYGENNPGWRKVSLGSTRLKAAYITIGKEDGGQKDDVGAGEYKLIEVTSESNFSFDAFYGHVTIPAPYVDPQGKYIIIPVLGTSQVLFHNISNATISIGRAANYYPSAIVWYYERSQDLKPAGDLSELPFPD